MISRSTIALAAALVVLVASASAWAWNPLESRNGKVKSGNKKFVKEQYAESLESYDKAALELPDEAGVHFDRGNALFEMGAGNPESGELDRAAKAFEDAILLARDDQNDLKADAFYNLGNVHFAKQGWAEAIEAYRQALKLEPGREDAAYNLALALKKLEEEKKREEEEKKKQEQEQEQKQKEQEKKDDEQCDSGEQGAGEKEKSEEQKQKEQQGGQDQQQQQEQQQGPEQPGGEEQQKIEEPVAVTQQEAEAILDALEHGEKNLALDQLRDFQGYGRPKVDKDW